MDFGVCAITKIDDIGLAVEAENLGYSHLWVPDSQMIWSDCYAYMALAARETRTIRLGTGVSVAGTRSAPVTAHSIATINRLAPGRVFLGIGTGNTAHRLMGQRPLRYAEFEEYVRVLRGLLDGEEVDYVNPGADLGDGERRTIRFDMLDLGFMQVEPRIPIHVSGFYHRTQQLAGRYGDGLVVSIPPHRDFVTRARAHAARGAAEAGRELPGDFQLSSLTTAVVLDPGETLESERAIRGLRGRSWCPRSTTSTRRSRRTAASRRPTCGPSGRSTAASSRRLPSGVATSGCTPATARGSTRTRRSS